LQEELWLSPALAEFADSMQAGDNCKVIFHVIEKAKHSPWAVLGIILCDILGSDYDLFSKHNHTFSNRLWGFNIKGGEERQVHGEDGYLAKSVQELLTAWPAKHPDWTLLIVVDRLDRCLQSGSAEEKGALRRVLKFFATLAGDSHGMLKFLFVAAHNAHWPRWEIGDLNVTGNPDRLLSNLQWRQGERP
jgi:hypothetical protein